MTNTGTSSDYNELFEKVSRLAGGLQKLGVKKGDRVVIYMPLIPEAIMAMLATVRLGAVHSVVFGGSFASELCTRIEHAEPKVIIAANCGIEPNKIIHYLDILHNALEMSKWKPHKNVIFQRANILISELDSYVDVAWEKVLDDPVECIPVEANDPLYILYTSGTTDKPKGIQRPTGGHLVTLMFTMNHIYGVQPDDVWWNASDLGWVVGHSYICYGPLLFGATSVMYEGKPDRTPDPGQYFRIIEQHKVSALFSVPTSFRVLRRTDPEIKYGRKYSLNSLRTIFIAGEHCDIETKSWIEKTFKVPVLNNWWQTETGSAITATCVGLAQSLNPPPFTTGLPFCGYDKCRSGNCVCVGTHSHVWDCGSPRYTRALPVDTHWTRAEHLAVRPRSSTRRKLSSLTAVYGRRSQFTCPAHVVEPRGEPAKHDLTAAYLAGRRRPLQAHVAESYQPAIAEHPRGKSHALQEYDTFAPAVHRPEK
ncbi:acetyl-CoA synthetase [Culex quinquefasciatus]|uniref:Acyl-CoA synthetase short-chain family member 3, mitochondrial n=1 Tax=Culex quinquefasciatus TaxID=7176 RepID=B0WZJ8_CULQU|nr:acetyl-CoA synthetase [Culex quinquefasciatus]|eukprot:XP_001862820.1 acetyl-CoA synthetase [Culex quinquefasciatus]